MLRETWRWHWARRIYIGYSDDLRKRKLTEIAKEVLNLKIRYFLVGTCIGAHSGPGVVEY